MSCALRAVTWMRNENVVSSTMFTCGGQAQTKARRQKKHRTGRIFSSVSLASQHDPFLSTDDSCSDEDVSNCVLVPRGCSPSITVPSLSPSIPIPLQGSLSCSPHGALVFSNSPTSSLPPLPCGSAPRRNPSPKNDAPFPHGSLRPSTPNRNSASSLLSMSTCSDTSYILGR